MVSQKTKKHETASKPEPKPNEAFKDIAQYLFLMEFFVHYINGPRLTKLNQMFFIPTSANFKFLDFDIEVTPVDSMFNPLSGLAEKEENFSSGRSIIFAISTDLLTDKLAEFVVNLTVLKRNPENADIIVGKGTLDLTKQFLAVRKEVITFGHLMEIPPQVFQGDVSLIHKEEIVGNANIFARMSTFGQCVITGFEAPSEKSSAFVFKPNVNEVAYNCRVIESGIGDFCKEETSQLCQVCQPELHACSPCELKGALLTHEKFQDCEEEVRPIQSSRGPKKQCGQPVILTVSGMLDQSGQRKPTVSVDSKNRAKGAESEHDIFILRIGKKGFVKEGEKCDIELHLKTPRGVEKRPPARYETREVQTEEEKKEKAGKKKKKK